MVARDYAPGGHVDGGKYWALNPMRADRHVGSFYVALRGPYQGRWRDEATGQGGDMLDLIRETQQLSMKDAIEEAKRFLGMASETPQMREDRLKRREHAEEMAAQEAARDADKREKRRRAAHATYLEAREEVEGTPVDAYLRRRAIHLSKLPRMPKVIRYHPNLKYYYVDKDTGEVFEGEYPAMVAAIHAGHKAGERPAFIGIHKTYLARDAAGAWGKAPVPKPKLIWGSKKGGYIRVWSGFGPRGGKGAPLSRAPAGSRLFITEGIEDALSVVMLKQERRVAAAIDLGNIREMMLPPAISDVTIVADNDPDPKQHEALQRAIQAFARQGRRVREWRNHYGGKDLNDALMAAAEVEHPNA